jgi:hypothetical protein
MRTWNRVAGRFDRERGELHVRSWIALVGWIIILGTILLMIVSSSEEIIQMFFALLLAYCLQGCLAELIGVRMGSSGISFPNRLFPSFPYLVLFRKNLERNSFNRVDFIRRNILLVYPIMRQVIIPTTRGCDEKRVIRFLRDTFPGLLITILH